MTKKNRSVGSSRKRLWRNFSWGILALLLIAPVNAGAQVANAVVSATNIDSFGNEFWLAFPGNTQSGANDIFVYVVASGPATVTVDFPLAAFSQTHEFTAADITAGDTVFQFILPASAAPVSADIQNNDVVESRGVHITSSPTTLGNGPEPFKVYGFSNFVETADAYLGLPIDALGPKYIIGAYEALTSSAAFSGAQFVAVATEANTTVTVTPTVAIGANLLTLSPKITTAEK